MSAYSKASRVFNPLEMTQSAVSHVCHTATRELPGGELSLAAHTKRQSQLIAWV